MLYPFPRVFDILSVNIGIVGVHEEVLVNDDIRTVDATINLIDVGIGSPSVAGNPCSRSDVCGNRAIASVPIDGKPLGWHGFQ